MGSASSSTKLPFFLGGQIALNYLVRKVKLKNVKNANNNN